SPANGKKTCGDNFSLKSKFLRYRTIAPVAFLQPAHLADELPLGVGHRLHRKARVFGKRHILKSRLCLDRGERHRFGQGLDGGSGYSDPGLTLFCRRVRISFTDDFADSDNLFLIAGVVEEKLLAFFHCLEIAARDEIAHAAPCLAFAATLNLIIPGELFRLSLHQPIGHARYSTRFVASGAFQASDLSGRVNSDSIAPSTVTLPLSSATTAEAIGISTARSRAISTRTGAV